MKNTQRTYRKEARNKSTHPKNVTKWRSCETASNKQPATTSNTKTYNHIMSSSVRSSSISSASRKRRPSSNSALKGSKQDAVVAEVKAPISNLSNIRQLCWTGLDGLQQPQEQDLDESNESTTSTIVLPGSAMPPSYHRATFWKLLLGYIPINMVKRNAALRKKRSEYLDMANDQTKKLQLLFGDDSADSHNYYDYCCSHWGQQRERQSEKHREKQQEQRNSSILRRDDDDTEGRVRSTSFNTSSMIQADTKTNDDCCAESNNSTSNSSNNSADDEDDESSLSDIEFEGGSGENGIASSSSMNETNEDDQSNHATYHHQEEWIMNLFDNHLLARQVCLDVRRVNPSITMLKHPKVQALLIRVLYCHAIQNPETSYVQGFHDLVTPFVAVMLHSMCLPMFELDDLLNRRRSTQPKKTSEEEEEEYKHDEEHNYQDTSLFQLLDSITSHELEEVEADVYWCFTLFLQQWSSDLYTTHQVGVQRLLRELQLLVEESCPLLHIHLQSIGVEYYHFAYRWMSCLLVRELSLGTTIRLFDTLLAEDELEEFFVCVCGALLQKYQNHILQHAKFEDCLMYLQNLPTQLLTTKDMSTLLSQAYIYQVSVLPQTFIPQGTPSIQRSKSVVTLPPTSGTHSAAAVVVDELASVSLLSATADGLVRTISQSLLLSSTDASEELVESNTMNDKADTTHPHSAEEEPASFFESFFMGSYSWYSSTTTEEQEISSTTSAAVRKKDVSSNKTQPEDNDDHNDDDTCPSIETNSTWNSSSTTTTTNNENTNSYFDVIDDASSLINYMWGF